MGLHGGGILADAGVNVARIVARPVILAELARGPLWAAQLRQLDDAFSRLA